MLRVAVILAVMALPAGAAEQLLFDVYLLGVKAGEVQIDARVGGGRYALTGRLESTGLVGAIRKVRYGATVEGRVRGPRFIPEIYGETTDAGSRRNEARMAYRGGVPQVKTYRPAREPEPYDVDPATQGGTVDPLTALYLALRDRSRREGCSVQTPVFDGRRATRLVVGQVRGDPLRCAGTFTRIAGYDAEDLAEQREFPFSFRLVPDGENRLRVNELELGSLYGRARLVRR